MNHEYNTQDLIGGMVLDNALKLENSDFFQNEQYQFDQHDSR